MISPTLPSLSLTCCSLTSNPQVLILCLYLLSTRLCLSKLLLHLKYTGFQGFPLRPARAQTQVTQTGLCEKCVSLGNTDAYLKAASSSVSTVFSFSDAVSWTTSAALSRASSARQRPASSKATSALWPSPLARLNSDPREATSPQSCQQNTNRKKKYIIETDRIFQKISNLLLLFYSQYYEI